MKNLALKTIALTCALSVNCFSQSSQIMKADDSQMLSSMMADNGLAVVSYHVEERINMNFGSSITTYDVPSLNLVSTKELGGNNTRVITPKYAKVRAKTEYLAIAKDKKPKAFSSSDFITVKPINTDIVATVERKREFAEIDVIATYERVMDKGYKSVIMITKVADRHFFEGDFTLAAKWYTELFNSTDNLEAVYYYRYAQSLIETGQKAKGKEMMKIFETKSL